jgi:hexokinase
LKDAGLSGLSADRSFATAYNATLQTANMLIACSGYRLATIPGHHKTAFDATELILGQSAKTLVVYFDACRRKRNLLDYDRAHIASDTEAAELLVGAREFLALAEKWIEANHPHLKK